ncbi:MAG: aminotransferase class V-fold PLP-dependent enzyme [Chloroflexi bacterium]|nr:aminotransferase class V-fold PLP-dependent enzyme [Chloroflexota bacterium]MCI0646541.1 aminotransferase class V-fold PLP-dependent enzyme [Chloroflexota bacterium]MCI0726343.1 aminotransferase class V-fold PLP-dependent enzyme [Chloroflexota bacterium]
MDSLKELFLLDPSVVFLNHGSFGAMPRPVLEAYQEWQRRLERQPVQFVAVELGGHLQAARQALGDYLNVAGDDLAYVPNPTFGVNVVARSLSLGPGDEVLGTNHEYGACGNTWRFLSQKRGFTYIQQPIPLPVTSPEEIVEQFWQGVTPRTKVIFLSHITSATALRLPAEAICARARAAGILTLVDGAHAPGQIALDLAAVGADFYVGAAHKWLCSPKGSAFLYTRPERQALIEPLVVGWGWGENHTLQFGSDYLDYLQWLGTIDPAAYLSVPAAIHFQAEHDWPAVRQRCHELVRQALHRICDLTGLAPLYPDAGFYHQMAIAPLAKIEDLPAFKARLYQEYRIEIPCIAWEDHQFIRVCIQAYNSQSDVDTLLTALETLLNKRE